MGSLNEGAEIPLFTYSIYPNVVKWSAIALVITPYFFLLAWTISAGTFHDIDVYLILIGVSPELLIVLELRKKPRKAIFYDGAFQLSGGKIDQRLDYSQITMVGTDQSKGSRSEIMIYVGPERSPLRIRANPRNKVLKTDLYSWLIEKTGQNLASSTN